MAAFDLPSSKLAVDVAAHESESRRDYMGQCYREDTRQAGPAAQVQDGRPDGLESELTTTDAPLSLSPSWRVVAEGEAPIQTPNSSVTYMGVGDTDVTVADGNAHEQEDVSCSGDPHRDETEKRQQLQHQEAGQQQQDPGLHEEPVCQQRDTLSTSEQLLVPAHAEGRPVATHGTGTMTSADKERLDSVNRGGSGESTLAAPCALALEPVPAPPVTLDPLGGLQVGSAR